MSDPSFEEFARANLAVLGRYALALTGNRHAAQDLVQETLVRLAAAWRGVRQEGSPEGYARTIMFRTYVSWWRALRRRAEVYAPDLLDRPQASVDADVDNRDLLRRALANLPRGQRAVLVATYLDDAPDHVIAQLLGRTEATVRSLRHRGLKALRTQLGVTTPSTEARHGEH